MRVGAFLAAALLTVAAAGPVRAADRDGVVATITDARVTESSALVQSTVDPDLAYTVNDSGDAARVYVLRLATGDVVGVTTLDGVEPVDVEALAIGADDRLYVADVGDNSTERRDLALHALDQPGPGDRTATVQTYPIRHGGGPQDVESLLIDPQDGTAYLVTKGLLGGQVLRLPRLRQDRPVASRPATDVGVPGLVTDGAFLPDGSGVVLRTYADAVVYAMPGWREVGGVELPGQRQGESLAVFNRGPVLYVGSEGLPSPIQRVRIPRATWRALHPAPVEVAEDDSAEPSAPAESSDRLPVVVTTLLVVLGVLWVVVHYRRRSS